MDRITTGLDEFDYKVVNKMAQNRNKSLSEVVRSIVHHWIEFNPELLERNYGIDLKEISEEIRRESYEISLDKTLKPFEEQIIEELPGLFTVVKEISVDDLADHFGVDSKVIKKLFFSHGKLITEKGLDLELKDDKIYKS